MAKTTHIELGDGTLVPILFENRSLMVLDKPAGWVLTPDVPVPGRSNLQIAIESAIKGGAFWARSRGLKFLRFVHRLDADTSGVLMCAKHLGAMRPLSLQFSQRKVEKLYLAVTHGVPKLDRWICQLPLGPDPEWHGRHRVDPENGKQAETHFQVLQKNDRAALVLVRPVTGRTHQIRLHLLANRTPVAGDKMYAGADRDALLGLRSIRLEFTDPFSRKPVFAAAPIKEFIRRYKFNTGEAEEQIKKTKFDPSIGAAQALEDEEDEFDEPTVVERPAPREDRARRPFRSGPQPFAKDHRAFKPGPRRPSSAVEQRPRREQPWRPEGAPMPPRPSRATGSLNDKTRNRPAAAGRTDRRPGPRSGRGTPGPRGRDSTR